MIRTALIALGILLTTTTAKAEWTLESTTDDFTDETSYHAVSEIISGEPYGYARLSISCTGLTQYTIGLILGYLHLNPNTFKMNNGLIKARIDENPIFETAAYPSNDALLIASGSSLFKAKDRIRIQVPYNNHGNVTLDFSAAGMEEALQQLEAACTG